MMWGFNWNPYAPRTPAQEEEVNTYTNVTFDEVAGEWVHTFCGPMAHEIIYAILANINEDYHPRGEDGRFNREPFVPPIE